MYFSERIQTVNNLSPLIQRPLENIKRPAEMCIKERTSQSGSGILDIASSIYSKLKKVPDYIKKVLIFTVVPQQ